MFLHDLTDLAIIWKYCDLGDLYHSPKVPIHEAEVRVKQPVLFWAPSQLTLEL